MMYCVQIGETEVIVELIRKGDKKLGLQPRLEVDANTDWEGNEIYLTYAEEQEAKAWVIDTYPDEVWL